jgi:hypothetical protein
LYYGLILIKVSGLFVKQLSHMLLGLWVDFCKTQGVIYKTASTCIQNCWSAIRWTIFSEWREHTRWRWIGRGFILNRLGFVSKISFKNGLQVDFIKNEGFNCKMIPTILIRLQVNLNKNQRFIYKTAMPHTLSTTDWFL